MFSQVVYFFNNHNFSWSIILSECSCTYLPLQQDESLWTDYYLIAYTGLNSYHHLPPCWNCTRAFKSCSHLMVIWFFPCCQKSILKPTWVLQRCNYRASTAQNWQTPLNGGLWLGWLKVQRTAAPLLSLSRKRGILPTAEWAIWLKDS